MRYYKFISFLIIIVLFFSCRSKRIVTHHQQLYDDSWRMMVETYYPVCSIADADVKLPPNIFVETKEDESPTIGRPIPNQIQVISFKRKASINNSDSIVPQESGSVCPYINRHHFVRWIIVFFGIIGCLFLIRLVIRLFR